MLLHYFFNDMCFSVPAFLLFKKRVNKSDVWYFTLLCRISATDVLQEREVGAKLFSHSPLRRILSQIGLTLKVAVENA